MAPTFVLALGGSPAAAAQRFADAAGLDARVEPLPAHTPRGGRRLRAWLAERRDLVLLSGHLSPGLLASATGYGYRTVLLWTGSALLADADGVVLMAWYALWADELVVAAERGGAAPYKKLSMYLKLPRGVGWRSRVDAASQLLAGARKAGGGGGTDGGADTDGGEDGAAGGADTDGGADMDGGADGGADGDANGAAGGAPAWGPGPGPCARPFPRARLAALSGQLVRALSYRRAPCPPGGTPHLILTMGAPGAGKSTVAAALAAQMGLHPPEQYVQCDLDDYPELLFGVPRDRRGRPARRGWFECLDALLGGWDRAAGRGASAPEEPAHVLLRDRYHMVLNSHDQQIMCTAGALGYRVTLLLVVASPGRCAARARRRAQQLGRFAREPWATLIRDMYWTYRNLAPWYAQWADELVVALNEADGPLAPLPAPLDCHPEGADLAAATAALRAPVEAAYAEADRLWAARRPGGAN